MTHVAGWKPSRGIHSQQGAIGIEVAGHQIWRQDLHFAIDARRDRFFFVTYHAELYSWQHFADVTLPATTTLGACGNKQSFREAVVFNQAHAVPGFEVFLYLEWN